MSQPRTMNHMTPRAFWAGPRYGVGMSSSGRTKPRPVRTTRNCAGLRIRETMRRICERSARTKAAHAGEDAHDNFVCKGAKDNHCNEDEEADGPMASVGPQCVQHPLMRHGFYSLNQEGCGKAESRFPGS